MDHIEHCDSEKGKYIQEGVVKSLLLLEVPQDFQHFRIQDFFQKGFAWKTLKYCRLHCTHLIWVKHLLSLGSSLPGNLEFQTQSLDNWPWIHFRTTNSMRSVLRFNIYSSMSFTTAKRCNNCCLFVIIMVPFYLQR